MNNPSWGTHIFGNTHMFTVRDFTSNIFLMSSISSDVFLETYAQNGWLEGTTKHFVLSPINLNFQGAVNG